MAVNYTHIQLRRIVIDSIESLPDDERCDLRNFIPGTDLQAYLHRMSQDGTYGDHTCLKQIAKPSNCTIKVVHADHPDVIINGGMAEVLLLGYLPDLQHYTSLKPLRSCEPCDFVAVRLKSQRKRVQLYIAKVLEVDDQEDEVHTSFIKKHGLSPYVYTLPKKKDESWELKSIIAKLSKPTLLQMRGLAYQFEQNEIDYYLEML